MYVRVNFVVFHPPLLLPLLLFSSNIYEALTNKTGIIPDQEAYSLGECKALTRKHMVLRTMITELPRTGGALRRVNT